MRYIVEKMTAYNAPNVAVLDTSESPPKVVQFFHIWSAAAKIAKQMNNEEK